MARVPSAGRVAASNRVTLGGYAWIERLRVLRPTTQDTPWIFAGGDGCGIAWLAGRLQRFFGWTSWAPAHWSSKVTTNEVWQSNGAQTHVWTRALAHDEALASGSTRPRRRHAMPLFSVEISGTKWVYVIGGDMWDDASDEVPSRTGVYEPYPKDVWRTADGVTWECLTDDASWGGVILHMAGALDGKLYVLGGQSDVYDNTSGNSHVWVSEDAGVTWTQLDDAPWTPRGGMNSPVEWRGELWVPGGFVYGTPMVYRQEVWSFDGATWTQHATPPWTGKSYISCAVFDNRLWVLAGYNAGGNRSDAWSTADGETWRQEQAVPVESHADGTCVITASEAAAAGDASLAGLWFQTGNFSCATFDRRMYQLRVVAQRQAA